MNRIELLEKSVRELYESKKTDRDPWADWLYANHVFKVADKAEELAAQYEGSPELARASGMLHDIADSVMPRVNKAHEKKSAQSARELLKESGFKENEIQIVVDDALRYHSCYEDERPQTQEGKALASADAYVHLTSDMYPFFFWGMAREDKSYEEVKKWILSKIERDINNKIFFDEVRQDAEPYYQTLKSMLREIE